MNGDSLYDQFSGHEAPVETPFANRPDTTKPYVNSQPKREIEAPEQKDLSYYAWWRLVSHRQPIGSFEQSVNIEFRKNTGGNIDGKNFDSMRAEYIKTYKSMINNI